MGLPHNEPVTKASKVNDAPKVAELTVITSASLMFQMRLMPLHSAINT